MKYPKPWVYEHRIGDDPRRTDCCKDWGRLGFWSADGDFVMGTSLGWDSEFDPPDPDIIPGLLQDINLAEIYKEKLEELEDIRQLLKDFDKSDSYYTESVLEIVQYVLKKYSDLERELDNERRQNSTN